jgi:hypothetical protein
MKNYMNPPIPEGFIHVSGTWDKAFVIEDVKRGNRFTWIPLGICVELSKYPKEVMKTSEGYGMGYDYTKEMLDAYGGVYVSSYLMSKDTNGTPMSCTNEAWTKIKFRSAKDEAENMAKLFRNSAARTRLVYGWEYDKIVETISMLINSPYKTEMITTEQFEEYGLYGANKHWIWTLTKYSEFSVILKKGDSRIYPESVYANNEWFESRDVGFRVILTVF